MISARDPNIATRNREREAAWNYCRRKARERDGFRCWAERSRPTRTRSITGRRIAAEPDWNRCGEASNHLAHIYKRDLCGEAWADAEVVVYICGNCHRAMHRHDGTARFMFDHRLRAYDHLVEAHRQGRLVQLDLGPRPTKGPS